jgi:RIO kinase 2
MSSAEIAASLLTKVDQRELRILQSIELGMAKFEFVPIEIVEKFSGMSGDEVKFWVGELDRKALLWGQVGGYTGFILNYNSYDLLALNALVKGDVIDALGMPLGMGKEADVLEALTPSGEGVAVKFHRLGRVSFRDTRRKREYLAGRHHVSWLYQSRLAAEKEYLALTLAFNAGVSVPKPIYQNRHTVVMQRIEGHQLSEITRLDDPNSILDKIIEYIHKTNKAGVIHADLSEFNIIVSEDNIVYIIDWPQYISSSHPNADEILERDVKNILAYFSRKFKIKKNLEDSLQLIKT